MYHIFLLLRLFVEGLAIRLKSAWTFIQYLTTLFRWADLFVCWWKYSYQILVKDKARRLYYETTERNIMPKHVYYNYHWCIWRSRHCTEDYLVFFCKDLQPFEVGMKQAFIMHERQPHTKNIKLLHDCKGKLVIKWKWHNYNHA